MLLGAISGDCALSKKQRKMPTQKAIYRHWVKNMPDCCDEQFYEKQCFACGSGSILQRCHINAKCEGGVDDEENLHLLCKPCHLESEILQGSNYWEWFSEKYNHGYDFGFSSNRSKIQIIANFAAKHGITDAKEAFDKFNAQV